MNVHQGVTIAMTTLHVQIVTVRFIVHVILAIQEMELFAKVSSKY